VTLFEVHTTYGTPAVLRLLALILAFLLLQLLRAALNAPVRGLTALLCGIDRSVSVRLAAGTPPPRRPAWGGGA
jgi:hypothetical protein